MAPALDLVGSTQRTELRPYQEETLAKSIEAEARGCRRQLWVLATGLGKTVCFVAHASRRGDRTLIIAHRDELISQAAAKARQWWPDADIGIVKGPRNEVGAQDIVVASVQSLSPARMARIGPFGLVIVDECFPAGTMVGDKRIEELRAGDLVPSFDETTGTIVSRSVVRTMTKPPAAMVRLHLADGSTLTCTPEHPLFTPEGWLPASRCTMVRVASRRDSYLHDLSDAVHAHQGPASLLVQQPEGVLLASVSTRGSDGPVGACALYGVRGRARPDHPVAAPRPDASNVRAGLLHRRLPGCMAEPTVGRGDGGDEQEARFGSDDSQESDARSDVQGEDDRVATGKRLAGERHSWRERATTLRSRAGSLIGAWVAHRRDRPDEDAPGIGVPDPLQGGRGQHITQGGRRDRRAVAPVACPAGAGRAQDRLLEWVGVDRVEVLEPGRDGTFGGVCPDGLVYNLEVNDTHTYLADGVVAHNCHHATSASYTRVLETLRAGEPDGPLLIGVTATPERADGKGLVQHFSEIVVNLPILWGIRNGYLVDVRCKEVKLKNLRLEDVTVSRGDYADGALGQAMVDADAPWHFVKAWKELAEGRITASFHPTIETAQIQAAEFMAQGVRAACISGVSLDDRRRILHDLGTDRIQVVTNAMVLTEGWDFPALSCIGVNRPTKNASLYAQIVGRGLRPYPGKDDCLVLDATGASEKVNLCSVPSLFGVPKAKMRNRTVTEALDEQAAEEAKPKRVPGPRTTGDVVTRDIDLFKSHGVAWAKTRKGSFVTSAGKGAMSVVMEPARNVADRWRVVTVDGKGERSMLVEGVPLSLAQGIADDHVRRNTPPSIADRMAPWRKKKPTEKHLAFAQRLGIGVPDTWTADDTQRAIDARLAEMRLSKSRRSAR